MTKRAWQGTSWTAGVRVGLAGLAMVFAGAAAIVVDQVNTGEKKGQNKYEIAGMTATAPNEFQAKAMMFSLAGAPVMLFGFLAMVAGQVPLTDKKKDKSGPSL